jgi:hypothetical protein
MFGRASIRRSFAFVFAAIFAEAGLAADVVDRVRSFLNVVENGFRRWDDDANGALSVAELDAAVADPQNRGAEAAAVAALKRASRSPRYRLPPLTAESIRELAGAKVAEDRPNLPATFAGGVAAIQRADRRLFAAGKPRLETVHQGKLGNCFCLAPPAAVLGRDPGRVAGSMFERRSDGGCRVRLGRRTVDVRR